jgi:elongation factor G
MVDLRAVCVDGKHHSVDSSEMAFKMAGSLALREAVKSVGTSVLEPISELWVQVPDTHQGEVLGDLSSRRAQVLGTGPGDTHGMTMIHARVPTSEIMAYAIDLRSMTGGTGTFEQRHHDYDPLPAAMLAKALAAADG